MKTETVYIADDGASFKSREACLEYEKSSEITNIIKRTLYGSTSFDDWRCATTAREIVKDLLKTHMIAKRVQGQHSCDNNR